MYGIRRFPITFYLEEWNRILDMSDGDPGVPPGARERAVQEKLTRGRLDEIGKLQRVCQLGALSSSPLPAPSAREEW